MLLGEAVAEALREETTAEPAIDLLEKWCDDVVMVGLRRRAGVSSGPSPAVVGRIGRVLDSLGDEDCLLVLDEAAPFSQSPTDPSGEPMSLAFLVEAWIRSHEPSAASRGESRAA